jgi:hypothetical protein
MGMQSTLLSGPPVPPENSGLPSAYESERFEMR